MFEDYADPVVEVSYESPAGLYVVLTRSLALYLIDLGNPDIVPKITRYSIKHELLYDGEPLPSVMDVRFDIVAGTGTLVWAKTGSAAPRVAGYRYAGTIRRTSTPIWIGRLRSSTFDPALGLLPHVADPRLLDGLGATVRPMSNRKHALAPMSPMRMVAKGSHNDG